MDRGLTIACAWTCLPTVSLSLSQYIAGVSPVGLGHRSYLSGVQLRIHDSEGVDFYVLVASGPIIEDCVGLRFAPAGLRYPQYQNHLQVQQRVDKKVLCKYVR